MKFSKWVIWGLLSLKTVTGRWDWMVDGVMNGITDMMAMSAMGTSDGRRAGSRRGSLLWEEICT